MSTRKKENSLWHKKDINKTINKNMSTAGVGNFNYQGDRLNHFSQPEGHIAINFQKLSMRKKNVG